MKIKQLFTVCALTSVVGLTSVMSNVSFASQTPSKFQFFGSLSGGISKAQNKDTRLGSDYSKTKLNYATVATGVQINNLFNSNFYTNFELFYSSHRSNTANSGSYYEDLKSSYGLLSRLGYSFLDKYSAYAGIGIAKASYKYQEAGYNGVISKSVPASILVAGLTYKPISQLEIFTEGRFLRTNEFGSTFITKNSSGTVTSTDYYRTRSTNAALVVGARYFVN